MRQLLILCLLWAAWAEASTLERGELFLQRQRYASEALQLPLANGQMTVLKRSATTTSPKGHLLLFADIGSDPERSARISALRIGLNAQGWHSWAVVPPAQPPRAPWVSPLHLAQTEAAKTDAASLSPESADEWLARAETAQALQLLREQLAAQLARLYEEKELAPLRDKIEAEQLRAQIKADPRRNERDELPLLIIIAEGMSAPLLAEILATEEKRCDINAFIALGPYLPVSQLNRAVGDTLAAVEVPLLDLMASDDHPLARHGSDDRRIKAQLRELPYYRQRQLPLAASIDSSAVSDEVKAFLRRLGW